MRLKQKCYLPRRTLASVDLPTPVAPSMTTLGSGSDRGSLLGSSSNMGSLLINLLCIRTFISEDIVYIFLF